MLALGFVAALTGCFAGGNRWVKDGLSASLADAKYAACQRDAERQLESSAASAASEDERSARIRHESNLCMQADGWSLSRLDGSEAPLSHASGEAPPLHGSEVRFAQASEAPSEKSIDKPSSKTEEKKEAKEVKEVKVSGPPADDGDDGDEE